MLLKETYETRLLPFESHLLPAGDNIHSTVCFTHEHTLVETSFVQPCSKMLVLDLLVFAPYAGVYTKAHLMWGISDP